MPKSQYGTAISPILYEDKVILVLDDNGGTSHLLAVNRDTGEMAWEQPRSLFKAGWSTPMIWRHGEAEELVVLGFKRLTSYSPSTGEEICSIHDSRIEYPVSSIEYPVSSCPEASTGKELFRERIRAPGQYIASPIVAGDKVVVASVRGIVTVIQVDDKLEILARNNFGEKIFATPAVAENKIYLRTTGHLYALGE